MNDPAFIHLREHGPDGLPLSNGGKTVAWAIRDGRLVYTVARCSDRDTFSRRKGRQISGGRLSTDRHGNYTFTVPGVFFPSDPPVVARGELTKAVLQDVQERRL